MSGRLDAKRVLITQADDYMGPAIGELFRSEGAEVTAHNDPLDTGDAANIAVQTAGDIDVLIANFAMPPQLSPVGQIKDDDWLGLFDALVHPLMRIARAAAPGMIERGGGKIIAITSAAPLRGIPNGSAYCAARGAQNAFIRAIGLELARENVQVNAIGQNYVANDTYYPPNQSESEAFQKHLARHVPSKRIAEGREAAELALFLASDATRHLIGQVIPFAGGWVTST